MGVYRTVDFRGSASAADTEDQGCVRGGDGQLGAFASAEGAVYGDS